MRKKFKFNVIVKSDNIEFGCVDMSEVNFEIKSLLERDPDAVWMIEELDDSRGPFVTWDDYKNQFVHMEMSDRQKRYG